MEPIKKIAFANALLTAAYIMIIGSFLFYAPEIFGRGEDKTPLIPIALLLLFVFSASLTGALIFGRPILWYLDNRKKEAIQLLAYTLGIFFIFIIIALVALYLTNSRIA